MTDIVMPETYSTYKKYTKIKSGMFLLAFCSSVTTDCLLNTCRWFVTANTTEKWAAEVCAGLVSKGQGKFNETQVG